MTTPSSSSSWPRRLRVSFWRTSALSTCSSVTRPISLRMSPRRSLLVRWLRTMFSRRSSVVTPRRRAAVDRRPDGRLCQLRIGRIDVARLLVDVTTRPRWTQGRRSGSRRRRPPPRARTASMRSAGLDDRFQLVSSASGTGLRAFCPVASSHRSTASRITSSGAGTPVHKLNASAACRTSMLRPSTTVAPRACAAARKSVCAEAYTDVEDDLPRRYVIGQDRRDFTLRRPCRGRWR